MDTNDDDDDDERSEEEETDINNYCDDYYDYLVVLLLLLLLLLNSDFNRLIGVKIDNATPYRVETICKTRLKGGLMNRGEGDNSIAPIGEVIGWIEGKILTDNCWNYGHGVPPYMYKQHCNNKLVYYAC